MASILFLSLGPRTRVNVSTHTGSSSGTGNLIRGFEKSGHRVLSVMSGESKGQLQAKAVFGRLKRLVPSSVSASASTLYDMAHGYLSHRSLAALSRDDRPDFIYERFAPFHKGARKLAQSLNVPYLLEIHGPPTDRGWFGPIYFEKTAEQIQHDTMRCAHAIRVVSNTLKNYFHKRGLPAHKLWVIPNAVDTEVFEPESVDSDLRAQLGLDGKIVVGFVGSVQAYHGLSILCEAASLAVRELADLHFLVVGPVGEDDRLAVVEKGLGDLFTFTGGIPYHEIPRYIMTMDICVIPDSNWYGSPIKLFEYGAMGKPVIAPRLGPMEDVVEHSQSALLFEQGDAEGLAAAILELAANEELKKSIATSWTGQVRDRHTYDKRAEQVLQMYESLK